MQSILEVNLYHVHYPSKNLCSENYESCLYNTKVINKLSDVSLQIIGLSELADNLLITVFLLHSEHCAVYLGSLGKQNWDSLFPSQRRVEK